MEDLVLHRFLDDPVRSTLLCVVEVERGSLEKEEQSLRPQVAAGYAGIDL